MYSSSNAMNGAGKAYCGGGVMSSRPHGRNDSGNCQQKADKPHRMFFYVGDHR